MDYFEASLKTQKLNGIYVSKILYELFNWLICSFLPSSCKRRITTSSLLKLKQHLMSAFIKERRYQSIIIRMLVTLSIVYLLHTHKLS